MKQTLKRWLFALAGKQPEAVIVSVVSVSAGLQPGTLAELVPDRRHPVIEPRPDETAGELWLRLMRELAPYRVALCAAPLDDRRALLAALLAFPGKVLAFHSSGERHHIRLRTLIASILFLRGTHPDRIFLRPGWLCPWKRDRSLLPRAWREIPGRGFRPGKPRVAVLSPYCPWPLSHGGAVRIHHLLSEAAREFDIVLFAFEDGQSSADFARAGQYCAMLQIAAKPRYREPRWSTLLPPEACEFYTPELHSGLRALMEQHGIPLLQAEYTQMARYGGQVLVEHDVTFDLFAQVHRRAPSLKSWWDLFRWRRFERKALRRYPAIVAMSAADAARIGQPGKTAVIPNGVDLERFRAHQPRPAAPRLLFVGSFRHFPNVRAYRFLTEEVWPLLTSPDIELTVVAGPEPQLYWPHRSADQRIRLLGFVADVKPLYEAASVAVIPTVVSAGTNLKALEAMAMERPVVSTPSGVAGLGLVHEESVLLAEGAAEFARAIERLIAEPELADRLAARARCLAEQSYGWPALGRKQEELWRR
ncbi:MAG: glycosyltransferase [Acidobacteria bacterium]|nr:glycosyltransferase [Acidobacteriota bacterium]